jgi:MerR family transcriptional regulator, redox-sensitive transcriptional activator SoxR
MFGIGEVARRTGLRPSAVRYYEERGLIAPDERRSGKRAYSDKTVERLLLILHAKQLGFSLDEIRELLDGFPERRWSKLASEKLAALETMAQRIERLRSSLTKIAGCACRDLETCAHAIAAKC